MNEVNALMAKSKGISEEQIQELQRERKRKEAEKRKEMGCWDCGKKLTTWDYPLGVAHIGTNVKLGLMKKKVAGEAYLCFTCQKEAKEAADKIDEEGACWICGQPGTPRACGVHLCDTCTAPKDITDITSQHGDGSMEERQMENWWNRPTKLLNCVIDLEVFRFTLDKELMVRIYGEVKEAEEEGLITSNQRDAINGLIKDITDEMQKEENEAGLMAAGLRAVVGGILMQHLYHEHPMKVADIQLEPGDYELDSIRPDGVENFLFTVEEAPVVLRRLVVDDKEEIEEEPAADDEAEMKDD